MKMHIVNKLQEMKSAGASWQRSAQADKILEELQDMLPAGEYLAIGVARSHYLTGEGRQELDRECNALIQKYREDRQPLNFSRTLL